MVTSGQLQKSRISKVIWVCVIGGSILALTIPSLLINYGMDGDTWRGVIAARALLHTGHYVPSRLPGNPLFEYLLIVPTVLDGHVLTNLFILVCYALCLAAFYLVVRDRANWSILLIMFAFTPILLVNASQTMDYLPGLAFLLWSYFSAKRRYYVWAYVLTGLAIGIRLPNALFIIPLCAFLLLEGERLRKVIPLTILGVSIGLVWYVPIFARFGLQAFQFPTHSYTGFSYVLFAGYNLLNVFGLIATIGLTILLTISARSIVQRSWQDLSDRDSSFVAEVCAVFVFFLIFARHADESAYLVPAIPFFYLLLLRWLDRTKLVVAAILIVSFAFVSIELKGGESGHRSLAFKPSLGVVMKDYRDRRELEALREGVASFRAADKAVVLHGYGPVLGYENDRLKLVRLNTISPNLSEDEISDRSFIYRLQDRAVFFVSGMSEKNVKTLQREGYAMFCFSDSAPSLCLHTYGYDPYAIGIRKLNILHNNSFYRKAKN